MAFFLESTFIGVWIFTWDKVSKKTHALFIWLVAIASNISALWILIANGWMQHPVGYVIKNGRAELKSFAEVVFNPFGLMEFIHTVSGAYILAGFFVMGVCGYHLIRKNEVEFFKKSFKYVSFKYKLQIFFNCFQCFIKPFNIKGYAHSCIDICTNCYSLPIFRL